MSQGVCTSLSAAVAAVKTWAIIYRRSQQGVQGQWEGKFKKRTEALEPG